MHHFFVKPNQVRGTEISIIGSDFNHIKNVLRMKPGEEIGVHDGTNGYRCKIICLDQDKITAVITGQEDDHELPCRISLFQGLPKADKMEHIIQKSVELGVSEIIPVRMKRSIVKFDEKKQDAKQKRWQAIAESAAKQSNRSRIPQIHDFMPYEQAIQYAAAEMDVLLVPYEQAKGMTYTREVFSEIKQGMSVGIVIGPEGGFEEQEIEAAREAGAKIITLGHRILRTETAGPAVLAMLIYEMEDK